MEKFIKYGDIVDDLPSAWNFVMGKIDEFTKPSISIEAMIVLDADEPEAEWEHKYQVTVYGEVE